MDRRSWLWRRKSSEKSPGGETESSGSLSSHSERFSDDQTVSNHNTQSPEVTSKASPDDELNDTSKSLSEKLSEALLNIRAKEDLVKQHSKVAEEAVSGWERAENEVLVLKKQIDTLTQKNLILEERVGHLDGALKECLRQLRQARDEQEDKIQTQLQNAKNDDALSSKLEAAEKENSILKLKLLSKIEELELSTLAAESASKQNLDRIKKMAKLEQECRKLKAMAHKATVASDHVDAIVTEVGQFKCDRTSGRSPVGHSVEIGLMDDFLEMERIAALPETNSRSQPGTNELEENLRKITAEKVNLEIALNECQIQLKKSEYELERKEVELVDLNNQLALANEGKREFERTKLKLMETTKLLDESEVNLVQIQDQLNEINEAKRVIEVELEDANLKKDEVESRLKGMELEMEVLRSRTRTLEKEIEKERIFSSEVESQLKLTEVELENLHSSIRALEKEVEKEQIFSREAVAKCEIFETELSRMKSESQFQRSAIVDEFRVNQDKELEVAANKFAECQKTIASLGRQLKSLATLDDFLMDSEREPLEQVL